MTTNTNIIEFGKNCYFNIEEHKYYQRIKWGSRQMAGVTDILEAVGISPPSHIFKKKDSERGRIVHKCCHFHNLGILDFKSVDEKVKPYVVAYINWKEKYRPDIIGSEQIVWNERDDYCGTFDILITLPDNRKRKIFVDIKSGVKAKSHIIQLAGYAIAHADEKWLQYGIATLYLRKNGTYDFKEYDLSAQMKAGADWRRALNKYNNEHRYILF